MSRFSLGGFSEPRSPGLSIISLDGAELATRGLQVKGADEDIAITAVASVPLTAEGWTPLPEGTVLALRRGREIARIET